MKRIVMIVPDQVRIINQSRSNNYSKYHNVTKDLIMKMVSVKTDYHENIFFEDTKNIRIESMEDVV